MLRRIIRFSMWLCRFVTRHECYREREMVRELIRSLDTARAKQDASARRLHTSLNNL